MQLSIAVSLHPRRIQWWNRRRHLVCKRYTAVLAIESVAHHAIGCEVLLARVDVFGRWRQRIRVGPPANSNPPFGAFHQLGLEAARAANLTSCQEQAGSDACGNKDIAAHSYS